MEQTFHRKITSSIFGLVALGLVVGTVVSNTTSAAQLPPAVDFAAPVNYATAFNARELVSGDFDSDGVTDLASISWGGGTLSVNLGNGDGTFASAVNYTTGLGQSWGVDAGDINNDAKLDLVVASRLNGDITIYLGVGDGTFQYHSSLNTGSELMKVKLGDFNEDGNLDVVASLGSSGSVAVRLGSGNGNFQASQLYTVGSSPLGITIADLNRDNNLDLIVANYSGSSISVLNGNGLGGFASTVNYIVDSGPQESVVADFNQDGFPDVVVVNWAASSMSIFRGSASGVLTLTSTLTNVSSGHDIAAGDINGDGMLDVAITNSLPSTYLQTVGVLLGHGDLTFAAPVTFPTGTNPSAIIVADFDQDGLVDLANTNYHSHNISILLNQTIAPVKTFLPMVTDSRPLFPIAINAVAQPLIPITQQGQIYYTTTLTIDSPLPTTGRFYLSSRSDAVAEVRVDDQMTVWADNAVLYETTLTIPQIVEIPRSELESWLDKELTITFRDVAGSVYGNSAVWLIWVP